MIPLKEKEKLVLELIVRFFILKAAPVSSTYISKNSSLTFSPATIRNIMASLEEKGYIFQPHTSSGRVPTSRGYRFYVDYMMHVGRLSSNQKQTIQKAVFSNAGDFETVLKEAAKILAQLSNQLSVIISPQYDNGIFHRMDITRLSSERLMLILSIKSGLVKTIFLEVKSVLEEGYLESLSKVLNERLYGLRLREVRYKFREIVQDLPDKRQGLIPLFIKAAPKIFNFSEENEVYLTGTHHILRQPEFSDYIQISGVVEMLEDKNVVFHLFGSEDPVSELKIKIGEEINERQMKRFSIISAKYRINDMSGTLGILGPMRMDYCHLIPLVNYTAHFLSDSFEEN